MCTSAMTNAGSMQATGLMAKDRGGTSDPFAQLFLGGELKFKTKVVPKVKMTQACKLRLPLRTAVHARLSTCKLCALQTVNPTWDETFTLYHKGESLDEDLVHLVFFDHDKGVISNSQVRACSCRIRSGD